MLFPGTKASQLMQPVNGEFIMHAKIPVTKESQLMQTMDGEFIKHAKIQGNPKRRPSMKGTRHGSSLVLLVKCMNMASTQNCAWTHHVGTAEG